MGPAALSIPMNIEDARTKLVEVLRAYIRIKLLELLKDYPLCDFFLRGCVEKTALDIIDMDLRAVPDHSVFQHFSSERTMNLLEGLFEKGIGVLGTSKEDLRRRSEFNFDRYDPQNFESARAVLRLAIALAERAFTNIKLIRGEGIADLQPKRDGEVWYVEVKTLILQLGIEEFEFEGKRYKLAADKFQPESSRIGDYLTTFSKWVADRSQKGRSQLLATKKKLGPGRTMLAVVANWLGAGYFLGKEHVREAYFCLKGQAEGWGTDYLEGIDALCVLADRLHMMPDAEKTGPRDARASERVN